MLIEHRCQADALRCDSGRCVPPQLVCDGHVDCGLDDDSDERNCTGKHWITQECSYYRSSQWRNKVAVGPRASIPKGPPLPPKNLKKNSVGQILGPPQRWARVHYTPCTPYCYATGSSLTSFHLIWPYFIWTKWPSLPWWPEDRSASSKPVPNPDAKFCSTL